MSHSTAEERAALIQRMMTSDESGGGLPRLWCPPLTHYTAGGELDRGRMRRHWQVMSKDVGGFLVPGSTGDGWEMDEDEIADVLEIATDTAIDLNTRLLVGVLRTEVDAVYDVMTQTVERLKNATDADNTLSALKANHIVGFAVCPPKGEGLTQAEIHQALARVLELDLPIALYQLPQVTENEISSAVFQALVTDYPNVIMFKDSSGHDRVPLDDCGESGVFLVRGAEGGYARWLKESGGSYDGLLLSTANCFAAELRSIIDLLEANQVDEAEVLSQQLTRVVEAVFALVADLPHGNAFTNANKAMDHLMAHGPKAVEVEPPMLYAGERLPEEIIVKTSEILAEGDLMPDRGYLEDEALKDEG